MADFEALLRYPRALSTDPLWLLVNCSNDGEAGSMGMLTPVCAVVMLHTLMPMTNGESPSVVIGQWVQIVLRRQIWYLTRTRVTLDDGVCASCTSPRFCSGKNVWD